MDKMNSRTIMRTLKNPESYAPMLAIRNAREYDAAVEKLNALLDEIGDNPKDPRYRLIDTLSILVEAYDDEHYPIPDVSGLEMLKFLMDQHGLSQGTSPRSAVKESFRRFCAVSANSTSARLRRYRNGFICRPAHSFPIPRDDFSPLFVT
jgi:HTH-type transcriptional regulator/antitoxin HigA